MSPPRLKVGSNSFSTRNTSRSYLPGSCFGSMYTGPTWPLYCPAERFAPARIVRVIKAKPAGSRREHDAPLAMRGNERRALLGGAVHIGRDFLAMPVQLFGRIGIVVHVHGDLPAFLEAKQRPRELSVVGSRRDDALGRDLDGRIL